jgi:hypothetical protein
MQKRRIPDLRRRISCKFLKSSDLQEMTANSRRQNAPILYKRVRRQHRSLAGALQEEFLAKT